MTRGERPRARCLQCRTWFTAKRAGQTYCNVACARAASSGQLLSVGSKTKKRAAESVIERSAKGVVLRDFFNGHQFLGGGTRVTVLSGPTTGQMYLIRLPNGDRHWTPCSAIGVES
jgi:hypothetical protein